MKLRYVTTERLPSGQFRYRFRRNGTRVTLTGDPGSPEFHAQYAELLKIKTKILGPVHGSIHWLVNLYLENLEQRIQAGLSSALTLKGHTHHLQKLVTQYGEYNANIPRGKLIEFRDTFTSTPGAADNLMKATSAMYKWAIQRDLVTVDNPTRGIARLNRSSPGFSPWVLADFLAYTQKHPPDSLAHTALMLAISTTARRSDIIQIGSNHEFERDGRLWLRWKQAKKPHRVVELPMSQSLIQATRPLRRTPYLHTSFNKPFTVSGFGGKFRNWCDEAGISKSLHGVRKGVSSLLPSHGTTSLELDVLLGHEMNSEETKVYIAVAERSALAVSVIDRLDKILL